MSFCKPNIQATGISKSSKSDPAVNEKQAERKSGSNMQTYTLSVVWSRVTAKSLAETAEGDAGPNQILAGEFSESIERRREEGGEGGERRLLALEKACAAQTGTRDVGDTLVMCTTVGTIKLH